MTTIIVTEKFVAADGLIVGGDSGTVCWRNEKKIARVDSLSEFVKKSGIIGVLGGEVSLAEGLEALSDVGRAHRCLKDGWTFLHIPDDSRVVTERNNSNPYPHEVPIPFAWGTGGVIARALLRAGVSMQTMIEIVTEMDIYSGGEWTVLERR